MRRWVIGWMWLLLALPVEADSRFQTSPYCWESPRVFHEPEPSSDRPHRPLQLKRLDAPWPGGGVLSHNRAYAAQRHTVPVKDGGTDGEGILIYNERPYLLYLPLDDHRALGEPTWINEKWVYVRVWWGRTLGTDIIIDVERERIVSWAQVHEGSLAWGQFKQCERPEWNAVMDSCSCYAGADRAWRPLRLEEGPKVERSALAHTDGDGVARMTAPCDGHGQVAFLCRLADGDELAVCGFPAEGDALRLQVRLSRDGKSLWRWPEDSAKVATFYFEQQTHVRSVSYHLWFERDGDLVDIVDHWTEGSHDSHFAGLIVQGKDGADRTSRSCEAPNPVIDVKSLADRLPHRAVPVP